MKTKHPGRSIHFDQGCWWFSDPAGNATIRICGMLDSAGWRVSGLCHKLGVSRKTFERAAKDSLGIPAKLWIRQMRAVRARHRLRESCPIKLISMELGFRNATDFASEFKSMVGITPSQFRITETRRAGGVAPNRKSDERNPS